MASFIMYFYFLYYDNSHSERQSFIKVSLLETVKKSIYIIQLTLLVLFSELRILNPEAVFERYSLKLVVHKIRQNPWHAEERKLAHSNDGKNQHRSRTVLPLSFPSFYLSLILIISV